MGEVSVWPGVIDDEPEPRAVASQSGQARGGKVLIVSGNR